MRSKTLLALTAMACYTLITGCATCDADTVKAAEFKNAQEQKEAAEDKKPQQDILKLQLPECIYAVPGVETCVYYDNIIMAINPDKYAFRVLCQKGRNDQKRWSYTPKAGDEGDYDWRIQIEDERGVLAEGTMKLHVSPANAGEGKDISILVVGDSLTNAGIYPTRIFELFKTAGNPKLKMAGSNGPGYKPQPDGVAHEGWGGWQWSTFVNRAEAPKVENPKPYEIASRFINKVDGKAQLDFQNYYKLYNDGRTPDFITFQLGVNDIFGARDDNREARINEILAQADILIAAARQSAPNAIIGVGLVTPGCKSQDGFGQSYGCHPTTRWQYKKNQHALNKAMLEKFKDHPDKKLFIIPTNVNLDCENNFPAYNVSINFGNEAKILRQANGVHPSPAGYKQIGDTYYAFIKYFLSHPVEQ